MPHLCTCDGVCRGAEGLGEGWVCVKTLPPTNRLPEGKTCLDCRHFVRTCAWLIGSLTGAETTCDWDPSRFQGSDR